MSLCIYVTCTDAQGNKKYAEFELGKQLAGFEDSRYEFWGHPIMQKIGVTLLIRLGIPENISVRGKYLDILEQDIHIIRDNKAKILKATNHNADFLDFHTSNILHAIHKSREVDGTLSIG